MWQVRRGGSVKSCFEPGGGSRLGVLIGTIQDEVSDIEVTLLEGELAEAQAFVVMSAGMAWRCSKKASRGGRGGRR